MKKITTRESVYHWAILRVVRFALSVNITLCQQNIFDCHSLNPKKLEISRGTKGQRTQVLSVTRNT